MPLVDVASPPVSGHQYVVRTTVRYEGVVGPAYFDMWNHFTDGGAYYTRNLAPTGPTGHFEEQSGEREVMLPFTAEPGMVLERLTIALVMPGKGKIWIKPMEIFSQLGPKEMRALEPAFFGLRGLAAVALYVATPIAICTLVALLLLSIRLARLPARWMRRLFLVAALVGIFFMGAGVYVAASNDLRHRYALAYLPSIISGASLAVICLVSHQAIQRSARQEEQRRMREMDMIS